MQARVARTLTSFGSDVLSKLAEDKESGGFFGLIGLGARSPYTPAFRSVLRVWASAIELQLREPKSVAMALSDAEYAQPSVQHATAALAALDTLAKNAARNDSEYTLLRAPLDALLGELRGGAVRNVRSTLAFVARSVRSLLEYDGGGGSGGGGGGNVRLGAQWMHDLIAAAATRGGE